MKLVHTRGCPVLAGVILAACSFTPDIPTQVTANEPAATGDFVTAAIAPVETTQPAGKWWRLYDDAALDGYIAKALARNNDLKAAFGNLDRVLAALGESRSAFVPSTDITAGADYNRDATTLPSQKRNTEELEYSTGFSLSYEIDLFGRVRNSVAAARADAKAARAALLGTRITVAAETARAYADICSANQQIAVTQETLDLQTRTVELTSQLADGGQGTKLDIVRAQVNVENTRASLPQLKAGRENARFRLATLVGEPPRAMVDAAADCMVPPVVTAAIPVGDGAGLLARRPDIFEAQSTLEAAAARVGVAVADLYPRITLGGSIDTTALQIASLKEDGAVSFSAGPLISWTFPNQWASRARVRAAEAGMDVALAQFDQSVLVALQETETALQNYAAEILRQAALRSARDAAEQSAEMARARYELGADDFITVLDAERTSADANISLAESQAATTQFQIDLFRALGGGWEDMDAAEGAGIENDPLTTSSVEAAPPQATPRANAPETAPDAASDGAS